MGAELPWLKAVEVLVLLGAGIAFCWWQLRDVTRERERSRHERQAREQAGEPRSVNDGTP